MPFRWNKDYAAGMKDRTLVNHPPTTSPPPGNRPVVAPIYQSVKYEFESVDDTLRMLRGEKPGYFYMRASNPTTRQLELTLAQLQGRDDCLASASGVNAIAQTLIALTRSGDHVLCFVETYGPTRAIIRRLLARFGVEHTMLSIEDLAGVENVLAAKPTRLVFFESPTNPVTKVADIERLVALAHRHGALAVIDNTFAGFHQHGEFEIDLFVHSLTKYASGAGDVMGGAVIGRQELIEGMRPDFSVLGALLDPHAAFLIQRGLKTYFVRYREQTRAAMAIAEHLAAHPAVSRCHYPGLPDHPQAALVKKQMKEPGTVVSFDLKAGSEAARHFSERLKLFALTASLGSTESLVMAPQLMGSRDLTPEQSRLSGVTPATVRLSIGLEDLADLIEDIDAALVPSNEGRA
jgi:cystathionine beta-lyase/cystathionine gamma-synthase